MSLSCVRQLVTPQQVSALEGKVAQCETALATCRLSKRDAQTAAKDSAARIKAIEIEVSYGYSTRMIYSALFPYTTHPSSLLAGEARYGNSPGGGADPGPSSPTRSASEGGGALPCRGQGDGDNAGTIIDTELISAL
jgi:hypothetical protein